MFNKIKRNACIVMSTVFIMSSVAVQYSFAEQSNTITGGNRNQIEISKVEKTGKKEYKKGEILIKYKNSKNTDTVKNRIKKK